MYAFLIMCVVNLLAYIQFVVQAFSVSVKIRATVFISKSSAVILFPKSVNIRDIGATMVPAIIFKIPRGAWPIRDTEDSYVHVTATVSKPY